MTMKTIDLDAEVKRLMDIKDDVEMFAELKKKPNTELSELGAHSPELVKRTAAHAATLTKKA